MPQIRIGADFNEVDRASNALTAQLQSMDSRIASVTSRINQFNAAGVLVGATIRGLTRDNNQFTASLGLTRLQRMAAAAGISAGSLNVLGISYKQTTTEAERLANTQSGLATIMERVQRTFTYFVAYRAFNFLSEQLERGTDAARKFQIQISLIRTLSQETQQSFGQWSNQVRGVSDRTGMDVNKVGEAFYNTISNQVAKGADVAPFVEKMATLAKITGSDLPDATNAVTATLNAYGMSAKEADIVSAALFRTIDEGRIVMSEVSNTIGRVNVLAANMGVSFQEVDAVLAITTQKGFKTSDAMTLLTNLLIKLEKPTEATKALFKELGVENAEQAIRVTGGLVPLMQKIISLSKSGKVDISAFFDEIRGRKQAAVFEQSLPEIEAFTKKLQNTTESLQHYQAAAEIRQESPAQYLTEEMNKISNVFKVDIGQKILGVAADIVKFSNSVGDGLRGLGAYKPIVDGVKVAMYAMAAGFVIAKVSAISFTATLGILRAALLSTLATYALYGAALAVVYVATKAMFEDINTKTSGPIKAFDVNNVNEFIARVKEVKQLEKIEAAGKAPNQPGNLNQLGAQAKGQYTEVLQLLAQIQSRNDSVVDALKKKTQEASEAVKVFFAGWTDRLKREIDDIRKKIEEAKHEIEKSAKSLDKFRDALGDKVFNTQLKYANDDFGEQKIKLTQNRIQELTAKASTLFQSGDKDKIDEARHLFDEIAGLEENMFDLRQERNKKLLDQQVKAGYAPNPALLVVSTEPLQQRLNNLLALRNKLETDYQKQLEITKKKKEEEEAAAKARLRRLEDAFKDYSNITIYDNSGKLKKDFTDNFGHFDSKKLLAEIDKVEKQIRDNAGGDFDQRFALERQLAEYRMLLLREGQAAARQEYLRTTAAQIQADDEKFKAELDRLKKLREEQAGKQNKSADVLIKGADVLHAFNAAIRQDIQGGVGDYKFNALSDKSKKQIQDLEAAANKYQLAVKGLQDNATVKDGVSVFRPEDIEKAKKAYADYIQTVIRVQNERGKGNQTPAVSGLDLNTFTDQVDKELKIIQDAAKAIEDSFGSESQLRKKLEEGVQKPLEALKVAFPDIAKSAADAAASMSKSFTDAAGPGLQPLFDRIRELKKEMQQLNIPAPAGNKVSALIGVEGDAAYAASGGVAGLFPGQPRGVDRYPIWAAKDEYIVNAESSRLFRPMLDAINSRRMPRYMASGGVVGGDTNVGDINITMNGVGNNVNGRVVGKQLERELRRRNINLTRK